MDACQIKPQIASIPVIILVRARPSPTNINQDLQALLDGDHIERGKVGVAGPPLTFQRLALPNFGFISTALFQIGR